MTLDPEFADSPLHPASGIARQDSLPPLLKWPGGKRALLRHLLPLMPDSTGMYYEPFLGGAALFFALRPRRSMLSDTNDELINCYSVVRDKPEALITALSGLRNTETEYYRVRALDPSDPIERAARLVYLTSLSFNGIHRVNLRGEFNVPYGRKQHVDPCQPDRIRAASSGLADAKLASCDFEQAVASARPGDVIYMDPPYTVAHNQNAFVKYNRRIFSWEDQVRLSEVARKLGRRGCRVVLTNADHQSIRELYHEFRSIEVVRPSVIAAQSGHRRDVTERIYVWDGTNGW